MGICLGKNSFPLSHGGHCNEQLVKSFREGDTAKLLTGGVEERQQVCSKGGGYWENKQAKGNLFDYTVALDDLNFPIIKPCTNACCTEWGKKAAACLHGKDVTKLFDIDEKAAYMLSNSANFHIYVVTWNMNGKADVSNFAKLLELDGGESYDLYAIGLQEAHHSVTESVIAQALGISYRCVATAVMMSLQLFIFAKRTTVAPFITNLMVDKVGVGGLGAVVGRQKGAVAVSLRFKDASLLFIVCHLSPHERNVAERNAQFQRIYENVFAKQAGGICSGCSCVRNSAVADEPGPCMAMHSNFLERADVVVWLGDLNYRVEMSRSSVGFLVKHKLEEVLWHKDQLSRELRNGRVFHGFQEGPLSFQPTYKYDIGTDNYDTSSKERVPSWTDRILYKVGEGSDLKVYMTGYNSVNSVRSSDHRPVKAQFVLSNFKGLSH